MSKMIPTPSTKAKPRTPEREAAFARQFVTAVTVAPFFGDLLRARRLRVADERRAVA